MIRKTTMFLFVWIVLVPLFAHAQDAQQAPHSLKYRLIEQFGEPFFCDRDQWPVARPEEPLAQKWFAQADYSSAEFKTLSSHLKLDKPADHMAPEDILGLYHEHKKLEAIPLEGAASPFTFTFRTGKFGEKGEILTGTITSAGEIKILNRETVENVCPKCLAEGTRIATPNGEVAVQDLQPGMPIWTTDASGRRVEAQVLSVARVPVPPGHEVVRMQLQNGRVLMASPEHPLADGSTVSRLLPGDELAGVRILNAERIPYSGRFTYDVLPSGPTGLYWAEGLLLGSTIAR